MKWTGQWTFSVVILTFAHDVILTLTTRTVHQRVEVALSSILGMNISRMVSSNERY